MSKELVQVQKSRVTTAFILLTSETLTFQPEGSWFYPMPSHAMFGKMEHQGKNCSPSFSFISNVHLNMIYYGKVVNKKCFFTFISGEMV